MGARRAAVGHCPPAPVLFRFIGTDGGDCRRDSRQLVRRRDDPQSLDAAFGGLLSARGWRQRAAVGAVFGGWADIVGPQVAAHTRPDSFDEGELVVLADSDAWAAQVKLLTPQLLRRLAEELGAGTVRRVRVRGPAGRPRRGGLRVRGSGSAGDTYG